MQASVVKQGFTISRRLNNRASLANVEGISDYDSDSQLRMIFPLIPVRIWSNAAT